MTPLVLLGSIGSTTELWEPQRPALDGLDVIALDHPGHGGAPVPAGPIALARLGRGVLAALDERGVERASFCGLSLGGGVSMWLAANAPHRVDRLVLACTRAQFGDPQSWDDRAATVRQHGMEAIADAVLERWFTPGFPDRARWRAMMTSIDPEGYARCCEALRDADLREQIRRIEAPTLVIAGAEDPSISAEEVELLVSRIPGARLVTIEGAAHLANVEQPEAFTAALLSHLEEE
ncbi:MAG TPA: 3-oxoadipate enol-lactonase [Gaiellaceae bacterium]